MRDPIQCLSRIRRPQLLIRAARFGLVDYDRRRGLRRLLPGGGAPAPAEAVGLLLELEAAENARREDRAADYSAVRHVELLIALMAEARLVAATAPPGPPAVTIRGDQAKASDSADLRRVT